jgi:hypothetical protein
MAGGYSKLSWVGHGVVAVGVGGYLVLTGVVGRFNVGLVNDYKNDYRRSA